MKVDTVDTMFTAGQIFILIFASIIAVTLVLGARRTYKSALNLVHSGK